MLTSPPARRSLRSDVGLASSLALLAGAANAIALRSAGVFAANMTGNVSLTMDRAAEGAWPAAAVFAAMVASFMLGAVACAGAGHAGQRFGWRHVHRLRLLAEAVAMAALGWASVSGPREAHGLCAGLAFLMGWQNALATTVSGAKARSTHLSGIFTDIGIDIAALLCGQATGAPARERLVLGTATCLAFCTGAVAGAVGFSRWAGAALFGIAAGLALLAVLGRDGPDATS